MGDGKVNPGCAFVQLKWSGFQFLLLASEFVSAMRTDVNLEDITVKVTQ
jgi:hypothetical protein